MLEYFTYKKIKKHQAEKKAEAHIQSPLITEEDENFLTRIVSAEGTPPPLPERPRSTEVRDGMESVVGGQGAINTKNKENEKPIHREKPAEQEESVDRKKSNRLSFLYRRNTKKVSHPFFKWLYTQSNHLSAGQSQASPRRPSRGSREGRRRY